MKVQVQGHEGPPEKWPRLMIDTSDKSIILVTEIVQGDALGTIVSSGNSSFPVGEYSDCWCMDYLVDFIGTVTLENDP